MQAKEKLPVQLIEKLKQLFQLDRPELDFGLYRIMHAKDEEIINYLENGLPATLDQALGDVSDEVVERRRQEYEDELQAAGKYVDNPEETDEVQEAKERLEAAKESANADEEVYDHLYRFFSRYYEKGDFLSRRYRTRETDTQAAPYAIPYNGEEVKLHWANADQYYIKTAEHFRNFRFDLREAKKMADEKEQEELDLSTDEEQLPVHFRIVEGEEGEHDNVQDADNKVRKLKPHEARPVELNEEEEVVVNFEVIFQKSQGEYIYDDEMEERLEEKYGSGPGKSDKEPLAVAETVFDHLGDLDGLSGEYEEFLRHVPPPSRKATPPLLAQYYEQFADEYEMDYFIHKDLGGFLRRELDFYIKNEVMRLDDIDRAEAPRVERYLDKVKALRHVAHDIIDFLAQLENFQKKLWLKKKFVVDTEYCVTLDRVPDELYGEILNNDAQLEEWRDIYAIEEWGNGLSVQGYKDGSFTQEFLEVNPHLVIDTRHFSPAFTNQLLTHLGNQTDGGLVEAVDGRCVQGENFQALNLLRTRFRSKVDCSYIDPPYNTERDDFIFKDDYRHSSWLSMMRDRLKLSKTLLKNSGTFFSSINDNEYHRLRSTFESMFDVIGPIKWKRNRKVAQLSDFLGTAMEYIIVGLKNKDMSDGFSYGMSEDDTRPVLNSDNPNSERVLRAGTPARCEDTVLEAGEHGARTLNFTLKEDAVIEDGELNNDVAAEGPFRVDQEILDEGLYITQQKTLRRFVSEEEKSEKVHSDLIYEKEITNEGAQKRVKDLFGWSAFDDNPKPPELVERLAMLQNFQSKSKGDIYLDFFAGSGTTGESIVRMNGDESNKNERKYILIEMADYFDTVMLPRLKKTVFSSEWDEGVPQKRNGTSHVIKYHRLESYEDTLNNLELQSDEDREAVLDDNDDLRRDYLLRYMLDVETKDSPSLLDIDKFKDPRSYQLDVKKPGTDASVETDVDLVETFNYLLGLRVEQINMPQTFTADFHRPEDPELPQDDRTRLEIDGSMEPDEEGPWWFRTVTGWVPSDPMNPEDSDQERVLVIWRTLTDDREEDNAMLDAYFDDVLDDTDHDRVYVNGSNNLERLRQDGENWTVHLLEKEFMERMWDVEDV